MSSRRCLERPQSGDAIGAIARLRAASRRAAGALADAADSIDWQTAFEKAALFVAHLALGIFLSAIMGILLYIIALQVALSIWAVVEINYAAFGILTIGAGAGAGGFLGWLDRDIGSRALMLALAFTLASAALGGWAGLLIGGDAYKLVGKPGIPALSSMIIGATGGANAAALLMWTMRTARLTRL